MISSCRLHVHAGHNEPFPVPDDVAGPEPDDSAGSCIISVGGTGGTSERVSADMDGITIPNVKCIT